LSRVGAVDKHRKSLIRLVPEEGVEPTRP
jgi:hypothetical protein